MFTENGLKAILNWWGGATSASGNPLYVALSTTTPTSTGTNFTEPSASTYGRVDVNTKTYTGSGSSKFGSASIDAGTGEAYITNSQAIYFPETYNTTSGLYEDWGTITHIGLFTTSGKGTGQLLAFAELDNSINPGGVADTSNIVVIRVGDMRIGLKSGTASASL